VNLSSQPTPPNEKLPWSTIVVWIVSGAVVLGITAFAFLNHPTQ